MGNNISLDLIGGPGGNDLIFYNDNIGNSATALPGDITSAGTFASGDPITTGAIFNGLLGGTGALSTTNLIGFKTASGLTGWINVQRRISGPTIFLGAAYNDSTGGILANQLAFVPEPSSAALAGLMALAAGANGLRRKRKVSKEVTVTEED